MNSHKDICHVALKSKIAILEAIIETMKNSSPTINIQNTDNSKIQNNTINNFVRLEIDDIQPYVDSYTKEIYLKGETGWIKHVNPLLTDDNGKSLIQKTDVARDIYKYHTKDGVVKDKKLKIMKSKIIPPFKPKFQKFNTELLNKGIENIEENKEDDENQISEKNDCTLDQLDKLERIRNSFANIDLTKYFN